ncbi:hypothetical protein PIB30_102449 [Stylosanthes scabra]|uniref:Uncharacterized protein n=1 Tax=Stylosanthes scabra TaxID=79078 RepID=A0ABU6W0V0_9FABA|nr:hypothetical protein [Stylosanthes scabra]
MSQGSELRKFMERSAMSSCIGLLPAPDGYLGLNPSMVHPLSNVMNPWLIKSGHLPLARTCSIMVPQVRKSKRVRTPSPTNSAINNNRIDRGNRMIVTVFQVASLQA